MLTDVQVLTLKVASSSEPTPELAIFWMQKYKDILLQKSFCLDQSTEEIVTQQKIQKEFRSPRGYIQLNKHILEGKLDIEKLEKTCSTAVRYLDDLVEKITYGEKAKKISDNYRAIKICIQGLELYLDEVQPLAIKDEVQKIAHCLATFCYRASESLAEEKGACGSWKKYSKPHSLKSFDFLINTETDETKYASDFKQVFSLEGSSWEVYQRRNLTILDLPKNSLWKSWDDYSEQIVEPQKSREPFKAVDVTIEKETSLDVHDVLAKSPYKQLFKSLLPDEKKVDKKVENSIIASSDSENNVQKIDKTNTCNLYIITQQEGLYSLVKVVGDNLDMVLGKMVKLTSSCDILAVKGGVENGFDFVYYTSVLNFKTQPSSFYPIDHIEINGFDNFELNKLLSTKNSLNVQQISTTDKLYQLKTKLTSQIIQHSHIEEFVINTSYFGQVRFVAEYINGVLSIVSGKVSLKQDLNPMIFGFLNDTIRWMNTEGVDFQTVLQNLEAKKFGLTRPESLKPLILSTHILKIIAQRGITLI
jgi:hypothetical protein